MKQRRLSDYPSQRVEHSSKVKVMRPPRRHEERIITYKPRHRELPGVIVVSPEQAEASREMRRKGIEYHQMRSEK